MNRLKKVFSMRNRVIAVFFMVIVSGVIGYLWHLKYQFNRSLDFIDLAVTDIVKAEILLDEEALFFFIFQIVITLTVLCVLTLFIRKYKTKKSKNDAVST